MLLLGCLLVLGAAGATLSTRLAQPAPPPALPTEEDALEAEAPELPSGPRILPARLVARTAIEGFELREGENVEDLPADAFFVLEAEIALPDLRLRLFDEGHRLVPADETIELGRGTRYLLQPKEALKPSSRYSLVADGQESAQPMDAAGQSYLPARFVLSTLGD